MEHKKISSFPFASSPNGNFLVYQDGATKKINFDTIYGHMIQYMDLLCKEYSENNWYAKTKNKWVWGIAAGYTWEEFSEVN